MYDLQYEKNMTRTFSFQTQPNHSSSFPVMMKLKVTDSPPVDSRFYNPIMDMNHTTQLQTTEDTNNEMEFQIEELFHCTFISDHLIIFLIGGIGISLVSLIGIVGNILCAIVLSRPSMRTSTNIILFGLSVCDFMYVFFALLIFGIPTSVQYFCVDSFESFFLTTLFPIMIIYIEPLFLIAQLGSTYFTLLVALERFFIIYHPLMARPYCTNRNAIRASLVIAAFTILFTMPTWWRYKIESVYDENGSWTKYRTLRSLIMNENYVLYYGWVVMFVFRIIPVTILTLLNISIYSKIRKANKMRESMTQANSSATSLAKMLTWIVTIFLICNLVALYAIVRELFWGLEDTPELLIAYLFLFNLNSSVNFIIYCFMAKKFRLVFLELFWSKKLIVPSTNNVTQNTGPEKVENNIV